MRSKSDQFGGNQTCCAESREFVNLAMTSARPVPFLNSHLLRVTQSTRKWVIMPAPEAKDTNEDCGRSRVDGALRSCRAAW